MISTRVNIVSNNYWSSTEYSASNAYNLNFNNGSVNNNNKTNSNYVRCVRGKMNQSQHLPLYFKFYQLIKFLYKRIRNFPKEYKYTLGQNILDLNWQCLDLVLEANALPNEKKYPRILELSIAFDKLKIRLRMVQEINLISKRQFIHVQTYYVKEIGEMIGGWSKWAFSQIK